MTGQDKNHELSIYDHINSVQSDHPGRRFIRKLFGHFYVNGPHGRHICLVHEPLGMNSSELLKWIPGQAMSLESLKPCIRQLLVVLDFLHSVAGITHTGNTVIPSL